MLFTYKEIKTSKCKNDTMCHCEEPFDYAQGKLRDEAISAIRKLEIAAPSLRSGS